MHFDNYIIAVRLSTSLPRPSVAARLPLPKQYLSTTIQWREILSTALLLALGLHLL